MARTNSRKISRRAVKKKSPLPAVMLIVYIASLCMAFVYLYMDSQRLNFKLDSQREEVSESKSRLHNLTAEVEQLTSYPRILRKIAEFKLGLRERIPGQVKNVRHLHADEYLPAQTLRDEAPTTVASRR